MHERDRKGSPTSKQKEYEERYKARREHKKQEKLKLLKRTGILASEYDKMLRASFTPKKGDVIITNGTSSAGILGHAGIATSSRYVFHIVGL